MLKQQDLTNKANEDFVKFKARLMHLGKEQVFQQSEKIELAKKVRRMLTYPYQYMDNIVYHKFMDMENIYDVFYKYYKERPYVPEEVELEDVFLNIAHNYEIR